MARLRRWATQQRPAEVNLKDGGVGREEQMVSRERRIRWVPLKCTSSQYSLLACQSDAEVHMLLVDYKAFVTLGIPPLTYNLGLSCGRQTRYFTHTNIWQRPKPSRKCYKTQLCFFLLLFISKQWKIFSDLKCLQTIYSMLSFPRQWPTWSLCHHPALHHSRTGQSAVQCVVL